MPASGAQGSDLVGEKIACNHRRVIVTKILGEGGFSHVYHVTELPSNPSDGDGEEDESIQRSCSASDRSCSLVSNGSDCQGSKQGEQVKDMALKVTSALDRHLRATAEKEAILLSKLSHPSIVKVFDSCYRTVTPTAGKRKVNSDDRPKEHLQHFILMELCEGGHMLDLCSSMLETGEKFELSQLVIAFGQICNAVSYLHAQRPPIVHRDLKPANFLIQNGVYKLCDFGSAVLGHIELPTLKARTEEEEFIQKTTTQMFRAPEMINLYMAEKLTQATDVWALGCCLYSLSFLRNCFEEGSNLAILSGNYTIPDDNPYGDGLVELLDRMLTVDSEARPDMREVILCLSAIYSGRPLPPRRKGEHKNENGNGRGQKSRGERRKSLIAKKLDPNSAAARRRVPSVLDMNLSYLHSRLEKNTEAGEEKVDHDLAFSTTKNPFGVNLSQENKVDTDEPEELSYREVFHPLTVEGDAKDAKDAVAAYPPSDEPRQNVFLALSRSFTCSCSCKDAI